MRNAANIAERRKTEEVNSRAAERLPTTEGQHGRGAVGRHELVRVLRGADEPRYDLQARRHHRRRQLGFSALSVRRRRRHHRQGLLRLLLLLLCFRLASSALL